MSSYGPPRNYRGALEVDLKTCAKGTKLRVYRGLVILPAIRGEHTQVWLWRIHYYSSSSFNSSFSLTIYGHFCYGLNVDILHVWFLLIFRTTWFSCPVYYYSWFCQKTTLLCFIFAVKHLRNGLENLWFFYFNFYGPWT